MRAAYVTTYDASDIGQWSGSGLHIARALERAGVELETVGHLPERYGALLRGAQRLHNKLGRGRYAYNRSPVLLKGYAEHVARRLRSLHVDLVFSPGSIPVAHLDTELPIVFWTDATFAGMLDFYPDYTGLSGRAIREGNAAEQAALERCRLALYASEWAASSALEHYSVEPEKVRTIRFGGNFDFGGTEDELVSALHARPLDRCRLLFIGVEWWRKGGDVALEVARVLNEGGLETELTVIGCDPPSPAASLPRFVRPLGFLSKGAPEEAEQLRHELLRTHFLILPARAECYGMVLAEASSFGVPALATDVGGIPSVVESDINGRLFALDAPADSYAAYIRDTLAEPGRYRRLALSSFQEHARRLNWGVAGRAVRAELERVLA